MSFPFGPHSMAALVDAISDGFSHSEMRTLFMRVGVDQWDPQERDVNKQRRAQAVLEALRSEADPGAERVAFELAGEVLKVGGPAQRWWEPLVDALAADGWEYDESAERLVPTIEGVSMPEERGALESQLLELGWNTAATHYRRSVEAFATGNWESANGQGRSFLEDLLPRVAAELLGRRARTEPRAALQDLKNADALLEGEFDLARGLWELSNSRGPHPGLSDSDECSFRLIVTTAFARFLLSRLPP